MLPVASAVRFVSLTTGDDRQRSVTDPHAEIPVQCTRRRSAHVRVSLTVRVQVLAGLSHTLLPVFIALLLLNQSTPAAFPVGNLRSRAAF